MPPIARVLPIIDSFDAMTAGRKYKGPGLSSDAALKDLEARPGEYDQQLLAELASILKAFNDRRQAEAPAAGAKRFIRKSGPPESSSERG